MKFSILIPAYNAEKYIVDCINSIKRQTFKDWECIIIDDGSVDNTYNIVLDNVLDDKRFIIKKQLNQGVAKTRNELLKIAKGEYIVWVDADDLIKENMLCDIAKEMILHKADIYFFDYEIIYNKYNKKIQLFTESKFMSSKEFVKELAEEFNMYSFLWNKVIKRNLYKEIVFKNVKMLEDYEILPKIVVVSQEIFYINKIFYSYIQHSKSITHNINKEVLKENCEIIKQRESFILECYPELNEAVVIGRVYRALMYLLNDEIKSNTFTKKCIREIRKNLKTFLSSKINIKLKICALCCSYGYENVILIKKIRNIRDFCKNSWCN